MTTLLLLLIAVFAVIGIWYIYRKGYDQTSTKKAMAALLVVIVVLMTSFMIIDTKTREIALSAEQSNQSTLALLLGWTSGGYSPYVQSSWGKTGPEDDFDWDGIKNAWDPDADGDGVLDAYEMPTRFNPFQPDIGITHLEVKWVEETKIEVRAYTVYDVTGQTVTYTFYVNNIIIQQKTPAYLEDYVTFTTELDPDDPNQIAVRAEGRESDYANKVNNFISYTIPSGTFGILGQWYNDLENQINGVIRNTPLFQSNNQFSFIENALRAFMVNMPLLLIAAIAVVIVLFWLWNRRRVKKGKPPLFRFGAKKKPKYEPGTTVVRLY